MEGSEIRVAWGEENGAVFLNFVFPHDKILDKVGQILVREEDLRGHQMPLTNDGWGLLARLSQCGGGVCVCKWQDFFCITNQCHSLCVDGGLTIDQIIRVLQLSLFSGSNFVLQPIGDVAFSCARCEVGKQLFEGG